MESPIGKLYKRDAIVLMLGTGYETCTVMHLAEYAEAERLRAENVVPDTVTCWSKGKSWEEPAFHPERFALIGEAFERENPGHVVTHTLPGKMSRQEMTQKNPSEREPAPRALARAMRIRALVDFSIDRYRYLR